MSFLFVALLALTFSSCETTDMLSEREISAPLRLSASLEQDGITTRTGENLKIDEGGAVSLTIDGITKSFTANSSGVLVPKAAGNAFTVSTNSPTLSLGAYGTLFASNDESDWMIPVKADATNVPITWIGEQPTATIAFRPATTMLTIHIFAADGTTRLNSFLAYGDALLKPRNEGPAYIFDTSGNLLDMGSEGLYEGAATQLMPFTIAADAPMFRVEDSFFGTPYEGKTYTVTNTSGAPFVAEAGRHYSVTVTLQANAEPLVFITEAATGWSVQPTQNIAYNTDYDVLIYRASDLNDFRIRVNRGETNLRALQVADISVTTNWTPIGTDTKKFTGVYNGNGYTINDLYVNDNSSYMGIFGHVGAGAVLTGIHIKRMEVIGNGSSIGLLAGMTAGTAEEPVIISLCSANGVINAGTNLAGLVGYALHTHISRSHVEIEISSTSAGCVIGGIAATLSSGSIFGCSADVYLSNRMASANSQIGGLAGVMGGDNALICASYTNGPIRSETDMHTAIGGLVGRISSGLVTRSYTSCRIKAGEDNMVSMFNGALVGDILGVATVSYCNADLAASMVDKLVGRIWEGTENNNTSTLADRAYTVRRTQSGTGFVFNYDYDTVWDATNYGLEPVKRSFISTTFWTDEVSPAINYGYNGQKPIQF